MRSLSHVSVLFHSIFVASAVGVYGISSRPDNPGLDRCFYENPVLARFVSEIPPVAGFLEF